MTTTHNASAGRAAPGLLLITLAAPLGMLLLFGYVFGGALGRRRVLDRRCDR